MDLMKLGDFARQRGAHVVALDDREIHIARDVEETGLSFKGSPARVVKGAWLRVKRGRGSSRWIMRFQDGGHRASEPEKVSELEVMRKIESLYPSKEERRAI